MRNENDGASTSDPAPSPRHILRRIDESQAELRQGSSAGKEGLSD